MMPLLMTTIRSAISSLLLVVCHEHRGHLDLLVQLAQPVAQVLSHFGIEGAEGLVWLSNTRGLIASARAKATSWRCPPDN